MNKYHPSYRQLVMLLVLALILATLRNPGAWPAAAQVQSELHLPFVGRHAVFLQGTVVGLVTDASDGQPLEGVQVCATPSYCSVSGPDGVYSLDLYPGYWVLSASMTGFFSVSKGTFVQSSQESQLNISLSPVLSGANRVLRIVLTWSLNQYYPDPNNPGTQYENDLDANLWVDSLQDTCHIQPYGINSIDCPAGDMYDCTTFPYACLETHVRLGAGPETISIGEILTDTQQTRYHYGVFNYNQYRSGVPELNATGAHVDVYNESGLLFSFDPPDQPGNFWYIFSIEGSTGAIQPVDCITVFNPTINYEFPETPPCQ